MLYTSMSAPGVSSSNATVNLLVMATLQIFFFTKYPYLGKVCDHIMWGTSFEKKYQKFQGTEKSVGYTYNIDTDM